MPKIHPTAVVDPSAKVADDAIIGPLAVVDGDVELASGVEIGPQVYITGRTRIGARTIIYPFSVIGAPPQILTYAGEAGELVIGEDNIIREQASIHAGSVDGEGRTEIGHHNLIQHAFHVAHAPARPRWPRATAVYSRSKYAAQAPGRNMPRKRWGK